MRKYQKALGEDFNLGTGTAEVDNPGGGTLNGTQISISTLGLDGAVTQAVTASWTPGEVLSAESAATSVTVPGALLGDFAMVSMNISLNGLTLRAAVDSANTVVVTLSNPTDGDVTLGVGTLKILVLRAR